MSTGNLQSSFLMATEADKTSQATVPLYRSGAIFAAIDRENINGLFFALDQLRR